MGAIVQFDPTVFLARYPEFSALSTTLLGLYFNEATLYHANDGSGPIGDPTQQLMFLNMLTAHIAFLNGGANGDPPAPLVGRIGSATEGSVSVNADLQGIPGSAAWFTQTKYGIAYWQATLRYRSMQYAPGPRRYFGPAFPGITGVYRPQ